MVDSYEMKGHAKWLLRTCVVAALSLMLLGVAGCAPQDQEESEEVVEQETVEVEEVEAEPESSVAGAAEPERNTLPERFFLTRISNSSNSGHWALADITGKEVAFEDENWIPRGVFTNGNVFVTWETSEYDEEWDTAHDEVTHYGLVDKTGKLSKDLTDDVNRIARGLRSQKDEYTFVDDVLAITCTGLDGYSEVLIVVNSDGDVVYTLGRDDCQIPYEILSSESNYHDGVICVDSHVNEGTMILDTAGNILVHGASGAMLTSLGKGYIVSSEKPDVVTDYAGNVLFDVASVNVEGDIEGATIAYEQPGAGGLVEIVAEKINPYGGQNKELAGLYSVAANKWIVPLSDGYLGGSVANDGLVRVSADTREFITKGYGATIPDGYDRALDRYECLMDYEGNIVLDETSAELKNVVQEDPEISALVSRNRFHLVYLQDGFWCLSENAGELIPVFIYTKDGKVAGIGTGNAGLDLLGVYPNNYQG